MNMTNEQATPQEDATPETDALLATFGNCSIRPNRQLLEHAKTQESRAVKAERERDAAIWDAKCCRASMNYIAFKAKQANDSPSIRGHRCDARNAIDAMFSITRQYDRDGSHVETLTKERDSLAARLAEESARVDWLEKNGALWDKPSPQFHLNFKGSILLHTTLRSAIDDARRAEG